jgi:hypothetical protein
MRPCGCKGCPTPPVWVIVHKAQLATVAGESAEESLSLGAPADDAVLLGVRQEYVAIDAGCRAHVEALRAAYAMLLDDVEVMSVENAARAGVREAQTP